MSTQPGQTLLHYRIVEKIGEGGMGEVFRAVDTTLDREVAIKLLPEALATNTERVQRFEREARLLASLNHPHIATIHGIHQTAADDAGGVYFLAMELVEGEDLEARITRGPIPLERAVEIAAQIATALESAHAQGIVHRDLKPANVKLNASGDVKVLDFGLAKALANESASGEAAAAPSMSPTLTSAGTLAGMIIGTPAYMSPEQARARPADKRADLWAFGCVLYEMLTGERCFAGDTISDTLASVLKEQPDWSRLPAGTPAAVRRLLRRCLAKDLRKRLSDAADARLELTEAFETHEEAVAPVAAAEMAPVETRRGPLPWVVAAVASVVAVAALAAWWSGSAAPPVTRDPVVLAVALPDDIALNDTQESLLELSPDGRYLVFSGFRGDSSTQALYLRELGDASVREIPDTDGGLNPFFSPDGRWIGFFADGKLKKIQVDGSTAIVLGPAVGNQRGAAWGAGRVVFPGHFAGALDQVPESGGEVTPLTRLDADRNERTHRWPQIVADRDVVLFTVATNDSPEFYDDAYIDALDLSTGERKTVFENASFARYVPTGHLVFARGGFLYGVRFDINRLEVRGTPVPVVEGVGGAVNSGIVYASISRTGLLAYVPGKSQTPRAWLTWFHADGRDERVPGIGPGGYVDPSVSPDGRYVAVATAGDRSRDIWVHDLERQSKSRLTFTGENTGPVWMPDGESLLFTSVRDGLGAVHVVNADGTGDERLVESIPGMTAVANDVSPDGRLALIEVSGNNQTGLYVKSLDDLEVPAVVYLDGPDDERLGRFSPDGRWIAYTSDESGDYEVFVRPYPGPGGRWQVSSGGGTDAHWSPDGRKIHYRVNRDWWVVDVESGDAFRAGTPRRVRGDLPRVQLNFTFGLAHDGEAVLLPTADGIDGADREVRVVVDWLQELDRLVPAE